MDAMKPTRRAFVRTIAAAGAAVSSGTVAAQPAGRVSGFDHVALPMQNVDAMLAFYRGLGFRVAENPNVVSVYVGAQMINFHRPSLWQNKTFTLRGSGRPAALRRPVLRLRRRGARPSSRCSTRLAPG
jgi:hypothetical protein